MTLFCLLLGWTVTFSPAAAPTAGAANAAAVIEARVLKQSSDGAIVTLDAGRQADLALDDSVWVLPESGLPLRGVVYFIGDRAAAARLDAPGKTKVEGLAAVILRRGRLAVLRAELPPESVIAGRVSRLTVGRETAWIDLGRASGVRLGDTVLIRRDGIPIARGEILVIDDDVALSSLQPLVGNALPELGDSVELWPAPGLPPGRINSMVLQVQPTEESAAITIVGGAEDGLSEGQLIEIYRSGQYIGVASALPPADYPLSQANMIKAASVELPKEGDMAVVRAPASPTPALRCVVFRVEENYCLLAAGEVDGVQRGEKLTVFKRAGAAFAGQPVAEVTVDKVNVDYSGAFVRPLQVEGAGIEVWDVAERREPEWPHWAAVGRVEQVDLESRTAAVSVAQGSDIAAGDVVGLVGKTGGGGVVLRRSGSTALVHVPPGWGDLNALKVAEVRIAAGKAPATMPAQADSQPAGQ